MKTKMKKPVAKKPAGLVAKKTADAIGWSVGIAGALMFLFGIILFLNPAQTLEASVFLLGFVLLVAGGLKLLEGLVFAKKSGLAGFFVTTGLVTALFGAIMVLMPGAVALGVFLTFGVLVLMLARRVPETGYGFLPTWREWRIGGEVIGTAAADVTRAEAAAADLATAWAAPVLPDSLAEEGDDWSAGD